MVCLNHDNNQRVPSFAPSTMLACGKGPFIDLLYINGGNGGNGGNEGNGVVVAHSWDIRKYHEELPLKVKIYDMRVHATNAQLVTVGTNVGVFV